MDEYFVRIACRTEEENAGLLNALRDLERHCEVDEVHANTHSGGGDS